VRGIFDGLFYVKITTGIGLGIGSTCVWMGCGVRKLYEDGMEMGELQFHPTYFTPCQSVFYPICTLMVFDVELSNLP